jgi:hypothetical protein
MPTPNITVNSGSGSNFNPTTYPNSGKVPLGGSVTFRAGSGTAITFYAYQVQNGTKVAAFAGGSSYTAPVPTADPQSYTLASNIVDGTVVLTLTNPGLVESGGGTGSNGTINVGQ